MLLAVPGGGRRYLAGVEWASMTILPGVAVPYFSIRKQSRRVDSRCFHGAHAEGNSRCPTFAIGDAGSGHAGCSHRGYVARR